jgi:NADPH-dependent 2,4-dienoyl-CoA reductase/sulfur reductase-like enzyme/rhodanese-related sulfurtransferase/anti-sigma regulatory factor (Ser/Thr protein kinase)
MTADEGKRPGQAYPSPAIDEESIRLISHQLKAPIDAVQALLETIAGGFVGEVDPEALRVVRRAASRAREASAIVSDLIDYQLYGRADRLRRNDVDIGRLLNQLCSRSSAVAAEKDIVLRYEGPADARVVVLGDSKALEQALRNVIENAVKYTPAGGRVTVVLAPDADRQSCAVKVIDNGPGVAPDEQTRIFEPFYRSFTMRTGSEGTGLGLPIARRILEAHEGSLTLDSQPGNGSTFVARLPVLRVERQDETMPGRRVVIVGGVTAGPKAAARLRRLDAEVRIDIIEKGDLLSYTGCGLPYYISGKVTSASALISNADDSVRNVRFFETIKNVRTLSSTLALAVDRKSRIVHCRNLRTGELIDVPYDSLVLATGATPNIPAVPGIDDEHVHTLYSLQDAEAIKKEMQATTAPDVAIVGSGLIGVSLAESLVDAGARVTMLERRERILADYFDPDIAERIEFALSHRGVKVVTDVTLSAVRRQGGRLALLAGDASYTVDFVILSAGVRPNAALAGECGLELGASGGIKVDSHLRTSDERIYAAGDCAESVNLITGKHEYWPLGSVSTKMGRIVADNIAGRPSEFAGSVGTAMFRIFDLDAARTGLTAAAARRHGFEVESILLAGLDRAHYAPKAESLFLKVIADRGRRVVLGAQAVGRGDVVGRIEILATAVTGGLTLDEVFKLDLGYHPAFNRPIDIAQAACMALDNKIEGRIATVTVEELRGDSSRPRLVDVSPASVHADHSLPGSVSLPLEIIRREEPPFEKGEAVVLYSNTSAEAYEAYRFLSSRGYSNLRVLEGGYRGWQRS